MQNNLLNNLLDQTEQQLSQFAESNEFASVLAASFGPENDAEKITELQQALSSGSFFDGLEIEVLPGSELEGASGAYASENNTVYLAQQMLASSPEQGVSVLLEEAGHVVDDFLNETDTTGDEGNIFASLVQENKLSQPELASLRAEDDSATLEIDGEMVSVEQAEFTVTNTNNRGEGSLRNAIEQANNNDSADTITFDNGLSGETIDLTSGLTSGQLQITDDLTIEGLGAQQQLTIDAKESSRVFKIDDNSDTDNINVVIEEITIKGGSVSSSGSSEGNGGGIFNAENLTLNNSTVSGNFAENNSGGIYNYGGTLTLNDSTISGNSAGESGGGIYNYDGSLTLNNSTVSDNSASDGAGIRNFGTFNLKNSTISNNSAEYGSTPSAGGISNFSGTIDITNSTISNNFAGLNAGISNGGTINLVNSTVSSNSADGSVGGINNERMLNLRNSTISGNSAGNDGGGIDNSGTLNLTNSTVSYNLAGSTGGGIDSSGTANLTNSTISNNSAGSDGGGIDQFSGTLTLTNSTISGNSTGESGAGINNSTDVNFTLSNSIIANNVNGAEVNSDEETVINTNGTNIVKDGSIAGTLNVDPNLSPLQDNGGPTLTQAPQSGSPAIDAGTNSAIPADTFDLDGDRDTEEQIPFDQRGEGFDRVVNGTVDLGAVEVQDTLQGTTLSINPLDAVKEEGDSGTTPFTFEIIRSGNTSGDTRVEYAVEPPVLPAVVDGQLGASSDDFAGGEFPSGTVSFATGETSKTLTIEVAGDTTPEIESEEFQNRDIFNVTLSNPSGNAQIEQATAGGEILNDDKEDQPNTGQTEPNTITTLLETSPEIVPVNTGFFVDYAGTQDSTRTFNIQTGAGALNLDSGATVNLPGSSDEFDYLRDGSTLQIFDDEGNLAAELLASPDTASNVSFDDGSTEVAVAEGQITFGGLSFEEGERIDGVAADLMLEGGETTNAV